MCRHAYVHMHPGTLATVHVWWLQDNLLESSSSTMWGSQVELSLLDLLANAIILWTVPVTQIILFQDIWCGEIRQTILYSLLIPFCCGFVITFNHVLHVWVWVYVQVCTWVCACTNVWVCAHVVCMYHKRCENLWDLNYVLMVGTYSTAFDYDAIMLLP